MRHTARYLMTDPDEVKRLIRAHPWATFVSPASAGLVASHYPVLLEEDEDDIVLVSHFGRPDDELHELGRHEILVIIQGPHDYVSSSLYAPGDLVPTWNHVTAHLSGTPEILTAEENYAMLTRLTDHFEAGREHPWQVADAPAGTLPTTLRLSQPTRKQPAIAGCLIHSKSYPSRAATLAAAQGRAHVGAVMVEQDDDCAN